MLLERIIRNLLSNAIRHNSDCTLSLEAEMNNGDWKLFISDSGKGVAEVEQKRIFEEFYQVENPERDRSQGLGLGLSIVHRLESLLELNMEFSSTLGEGTRFTFTVQPGSSSENQPVVTTSSVVTMTG